MTKAKAQGRTSGPVTVSCIIQSRPLEVPTDYPILQLLDDAGSEFGEGRMFDHNGDHVSASASELEGGQYIWKLKTIMPGEFKPKRFRCYRKAAGYPPLENVREVSSDQFGRFRYCELACVAGGWFTPKCIILGDPEVARVYPPQQPADTVKIPASLLGEYIINEEPVAMSGVGWWGSILEYILGAHDQGTSAAPAEQSNPDKEL